MRDHDLEPKFSWTLAFFITGISFLSFFYLLEKLNEPRPAIFFWIGITTLGMSVISGMVSLIMKHRSSSPQHQHIDQ
jgi:hypothetical protein